MGKQNEKKRSAAGKHSKKIATLRAIQAKKDSPLTAQKLALEKEILLNAIARYRKSFPYTVFLNKTRIAQMMGINRVTVVNLLKKHKLTYFIRDPYNK